MILLIETFFRIIALLMVLFQRRALLESESGKVSFHGDDKKETKGGNIGSSWSFLNCKIRCINLPFIRLPSKAKRGHT